MIDRTFIEWFSFETLLEEKGMFFDSLIFFLVEVVDDNSFLYSTSTSSVLWQKSL